MQEAKILMLICVLYVIIIITTIIITPIKLSSNFPFSM